MDSGRWQASGRFAHTAPYVLGRSRVIMESTDQQCALPCAGLQRKGFSMAAMKPRTGDGPLEVTKEGRGIVMRVPLEGGGRLVVELTPDEATALGDALKGAVG